MDKKALRIQHLGFKFKPEDRCFFKELSMTLDAGKLYFLRGENGAGKSTLLRLLQGGAEKGEQMLGTIEIQGHLVKFNELSKPSNQALFKHISLVPQKFDEMLASQLSFKQNLSLASMGRYPRLSKLPEHQVIPHFVERFFIDLDKPIHSLSGGQRQVLSILMALQKDATVLLLDEPTAALDDQNADMVMSFLTELVAASGLTVLIICHDKELILKYAQHGYFELTVDKEKGQRSLRFVE